METCTQVFRGNHGSNKAETEKISKRKEKNHHKKIQKNLKRNTVKRGMIKISTLNL